MHVVGSHLALDGALRETQPGANLQKTLPACLIMRMTCSSIPWLRDRGATVFPWSYDTFSDITRYTCCTVCLDLGLGLVSARIIVHYNPEKYIVIWLIKYMKQNG